MGKSNFLFYRDWYEVIKDFAPDERLQVYDAIAKYAFEGTLPDNKFIQVATALMCSTIDRDNLKYETKCERNRLNIKRRWNNTNDTTEYNPIRPNTNNTDNDNDNVNDNDNDNDNDNENIDKRKINKKEKFNFDFCDPAYLETVKKWLQYKSARRETYKTQQSLEAFYKKLLKLSNNEPYIAEAIIEESMANNWQGIFALRNDITPAHPDNIKLGVGERIDNGRRTYGTGRVTIPMNAPARPDERWIWNAETQRWEL